MNELKAFNCVESDLQEFCEPRLVYLKSEADKAIAHHKYKRCLAMADKCEAWIRLDVSPRHTHRFIRWYKIWLAIANKFKEAK